MLFKQHKFVKDYSRRLPKQRIITQTKSPPPRRGKRGGNPNYSSKSLFPTPDSTTQVNQPSKTPSIFPALGEDVEQRGKGRTREEQQQQKKKSPSWRPLPVKAILSLTAKMDDLLKRRLSSAGGVVRANYSIEDFELS